MKLTDADLIELGTHDSEVVVIVAREITLDEVKGLYEDYKLHARGKAPYNEDGAYEEVNDKISGFESCGWCAHEGPEPWAGGDSELACDKLDLPKKLNPIYFMYGVGGNLG